MHDEDWATCAPLPAITPGLALVVDDVEVNRILGRAHLELLGWKVADCDSGASAMKFIQQSMPQAMLIDIRMPGMSGDQLVHRIRMMAGPEALLVGYTAHCVQEDVRRFMKAGFDHVLIKPVSMQEMAAVMTLASQPGGAGKNR